uniref:Uncharacterized protein n=1 Tax=Yersinia enterocolitica TaxID=630 RepID=B0RKY3_YEREN|nr:hypothetical protein [Yersinia enterocolitica]
MMLNSMWLHSMANEQHLPSRELYRKKLPDTPATKKALIQWPPMKQTANCLTLWTVKIIEQGLKPVLTIIWRLTKIMLKGCIRLALLMKNSSIA